MHAKLDSHPSLGRPRRSRASMVMGCVFFFACVASGQDSNSSGYGDSGGFPVDTHNPENLGFADSGGFMLDTGGYNGTNNQGSGLSGSFALNTQGFAGSVDANQTGFADSGAFALDTSGGTASSQDSGQTGFGDSAGFPLDTRNPNSFANSGFADSGEFELDTGGDDGAGQSGFSDSGGFGLDTRNQYASPLDPNVSGFADSGGFPLDTTDGSGGPSQPVNSPPVGLTSVGPLSVAENQSVGTFVGEFNATDPDVNSTITYHLVSGAGDPGNSFFNLDTNGTLRTSTVFDFEGNATTYSIRVQAKDEWNATMDGMFTVSIQNLPDADYLDSTAQAILDYSISTGLNEFTMWGPSAGDLSVNAPLTLNGTLNLVFETSHDFHLLEPLTLDGNQTLIIRAGGNIYFHAPLTASQSGGELMLEYGLTQTNSGNSSDFIIRAPVNLQAGPNFFTRRGSDGSLEAYTVITALGESVDVSTAPNPMTLQGINTSTNENYVLGSDIDAQSTATWAGGAGFTPIGSSSNQFRGKFDGLGHSISGLTINRPTTDYIGLFGDTYQSRISNLALDQVSITGKNSVGGIAGGNYLSNLAGEKEFNNLSVSGQITGEATLGGIVGFARFTNVANSYVTASLHSTATTGKVGGFFGHNHEYSKIDNSYSTGALSGGDSLGGLIGGKHHGPTNLITDSFWDTESSGVSSSHGGTAKTTAELTDPNTYISAGWDLSATTGPWKTEAGKYPILVWQTYPEIIIVPITDANFQDAVNLWFSDEANATYTYGHISDWNVSAVTNMSNAFEGRSTFNEDISQWDTSSVISFWKCFQNASSFDQAIGDWNTSSATNMREMLVGASSFNQPIGNWDVSSVTTMVWMFYQASSFNQPIGNWDVSSVIQMEKMFWQATSFNQPIDSWDTSSVVDMSYMFRETQAFNQDLNNWDVSSVINMRDMFRIAEGFNGQIGNWDVSSVNNMETLFYGASFFNQDIGDWDVSSVTKFWKTFRGANSFNQNVSDWNVSAVTNMDDMFGDAVALSNSNKGDIHKSFSSNLNWLYDWSEFVTYEPITDANFQDAVNLWFSDEANATYTYGHISDWNVSQVTNMEEAFKDRSSFDASITAWDVSNVTNMNNLFHNASTFNQPIGNWDISSATSLRSMFNGASNFNQPIGDWNTSSVTNMISIFQDAVTFNQDIGDWNTSNMVHMRGVFQGATNFNQDIGEWDTSSLTTTDNFFKNATSFDQDISNWDTATFTDVNQMFNNAIAFDQDLSDWNMSSATNFSQMFHGASLLSTTNKGLIHKTFSTNLNWSYDWSEFVVYEPITDANFQDAVNLWFSNEANATYNYGHISDWNVSAVTNMSQAFKDRTTFNEDISNWDVGNVVNMWQMFLRASAFNQGISGWDVSSVNSLSSTFEGATSFNQDISGWDTSSVVTLMQTFRDATNFNQPLNDWNTSSVVNMQTTFGGATAFNQPIGNWDVSSVVTMAYMFSGATNFNQDISGWDINKVTTLKQTFRNASSFNQDISDWNTSSVTTMHETFYGATAFNQPIWKWDVSAVSSMYGMLRGTVNFNADLSGWDVSSVTDMSAMFYGTEAFNQNISDWNTSSVTSMWLMFKVASAFDQDVSGWDLSSIDGNGVGGMFDGASSLSNLNKGKIYAAFSPQETWDHDWSAFLPVEINDANFQDAIHLWFSNQAIATTTYGHISDWNVSLVTDMSEAFKDRASFDENITAWDMSNVTGMNHMFANATSFNQSIGDWNVSEVTNMDAMFQGASAFNHDLGNWNTAKATNMESMFHGASAFNQDISDWNISGVTNMYTMFLNASDLSNINKGLIHKSFSSNQNWTIDWSEFVTYEPITDANFQDAVNLWFSDEANATYTYGHISDWNVIAVTDMSNAFENKATFNENISGWNVSNVTNMKNMFRGATAFNQSIGDWNVSNVTNMEKMFNGAVTFNQPVGEWNISAVSIMRDMFKAASSFNQPIIKWETSSVTSMWAMFWDASSFDQDLGEWNTTSVSNMSAMFLNANALSNMHKGLIHESFSPNPSWPYDWSAFAPAPPPPDGNYTTPDAGHHSPDDSYHSPDMAQGTPDDGYGSPDGNYTSPDDHFVTPDDGHHTPDDGRNSPDGLYGSPDDMHGTPDNSYQTPDTGQGTPDDGYGSPDANYTTPDDHFMTPDDGHHTPDDGHHSPDDQYGSPDDMHGTPDDFYQTPDIGQGTPNDGYGSPDGNYTSPDDHFVTPDDGHHSPDDGHHSPDDLYGSPDDMHGTPDDFYQSPDMGQGTPDDGYGSPDGNYTTPDDHLQSPEDVYTSPDMGEDEPPNQPPVELNATLPLFIAENQPADTEIGGFFAFDPDGDALTFILLSESNESMEAFMLDPNGSLRSNRSFDFERDPPTFELSVSAMDQEGAAIESNFTVTLLDELEDLDGDAIEDAYDFDIDGDGYSNEEEEAYGSDPRDAQSVANAAPFFIGTMEFEVSENLPVGEILGKIEASDPDGPVPLVVRLIEGRSEHFLLDGNASLITLKSFDFESDPNSFQLGVLVTDDRNTTTEEDIIVRVVNVVEDLDGDGFEDAFDPDLDGDGLPNFEEEFYGTDPRLFDTDDDGLSDGEEVELGTFGLFEDSDEDGLADGTEIGIGTNPLLADTDGDGFGDEEEVLAGSFPEDANDYPGKQVVVERDPNEFEGMIYKLSEQSFTWEEAQAYAAEQGAEIPFIEPGDPVLPFLGKLLRRELDRKGSAWVDGMPDPSMGRSPILTVRRGLRFTSPSRTFPVLLAWEKPEILLPGVVTLQHEILDGVVIARGELVEDGGEMPYRIGFHLSENLEVLAEDPTLRMVSATITGTVFEANIDRLQAGKTYYLRAFAENSAGVSVGRVETLRTAERSSLPFQGVLLESGWVESDWFGTFQINEGMQWIFHIEFGWIYHGPTDQNGIWFWKENEGWFWTRKDIWPFLWQQDSANWLYYFGTHGTGPTFWDYQGKVLHRW